MFHDVSGIAKLPQALSDGTHNTVGESTPLLISEVKTLGNERFQDDDEDGRNITSKSYLISLFSIIALFAMSIFFGFYSLTKLEEKYLTLEAEYQRMMEDLEPTTYKLQEAETNILVLNYSGGNLR